MECEGTDFLKSLSSPHPAFTAILLNEQYIPHITARVSSDQMRQSFSFRNVDEVKLLLAIFFVKSNHSELKRSVIPEG